MGTLELSKISFKRNGATTIREMADEYKKQISRPNQTIGTIIQDLIYFKKNNSLIVTDDKVILYF